MYSNKSSSDHATRHRSVTVSHNSLGFYFFLVCQLKPKELISMLPVLVREGMVPRQRARLRRPGREEGDALRSRGLCWRLMSLERLGGGVGMKESARSGESKGGWLLKGGTARYLQHKSNVTVYYLKSTFITKLSKGFNTEKT